MKKILFAIAIFLGLAIALPVIAKPVVTDQMIHAIAMQESRNRTGVVGDKHLKQYSYGKYQIRQAYLDDVIRRYGKDFRKEFGISKPTLKQIQWNDKMGKWVVKHYLLMYGENYEKKTGNKLTPMIAFQIHNGGPNGWNPAYKLLHKDAYAYSVSTMSWYKNNA